MGGGLCPRVESVPNRLAVDWGGICTAAVAEPFLTQHGIDAIGEDLRPHGLTWVANAGVSFVGSGECALLFRSCQRNLQECGFDSCEVRPNSDPPRLPTVSRRVSLISCRVVVPYSGWINLEKACANSGGPSPPTVGELTHRP